MTTINVATDFYKRPAGRFKKDGSYSGEAFRDDVLTPKLKALSENERLIIDFSEVSMSASSFLEEAFGGLVRGGFTSRELEQKIKIVAHNNPAIPEKVWEYIRSA